MRTNSTKKILAALILLLSPLTMLAQKEAYAVYTESNTTLTFYYDTQRSSRGTTYGLNSGNSAPGWMENGIYKNVTKVVFDSSFKDARPISTDGWFYKMTKLISISGMKEYLNTSEVTDMNGMFEDCSSLASLDVSGFNTANVTDMAFMFYRCSSLESLDVSNFNTANVTIMACMFDHCSLLTSLDVSNFNTEKVTDMSWMFASCSSLTSLDLSGFNTENVTDMRQMFYDCSKLENLDVSGFNTENVTDMRMMFYDCPKLEKLDVSSFNTENVTDMSSMFSDCSNLTTIYCNDDWNKGKPKSSYMFLRCTSLVGGNGMVYKASYTDATYAHPDAEGNPGYFTKKPEAYAVYTESDKTLTFYYDTQRDTRTDKTYSLNSGNNDPDWYAYSEGVYFNTTTVVFDASFKEARPTSTYCWFSYMENLNSIIGMKEYLNTSQVTNMSRMFYFCTDLTSLDVSGFNTENVTNMRYMFYGCEGLTSLDVSNFNTEKVTDMRNMFEECFYLTTIICDNDWYKEGLYSGSMFASCNRLVGGQGTSYKSSKVANATYAHPDTADNPGYFTKFVLGDANGDGKVTITDAVAVVNYILGSTQGVFIKRAADVDGNGDISITDAVGIVNIILNSSPAGVKERRVLEEVGLDKDPE